MSYQARLTRLFVLSFALLMASLLLARFFTTAQAQGSTTVTVNTTSIVMDGITSTVSLLLANPGADGKISFTEALAAVNNTGARYTINFNLPMAPPSFSPPRLFSTNPTSPLTATRIMTVLPM